METTQTPTTIADTQECQAIVDRPARHDPDPRDGRSWRVECDLKATQKLEAVQ